MHPSTTPTDSALPLQAPRLRRRFACWIYEGLLLLGLVLISSFALSTAAVLVGSNISPHTLQLLLFLLLGAYFSYFWRKGQTLAMKTWHLQVVDKNGRPLSHTRALTRYALSWLWTLPPLAVAALLDLDIAQLTLVSATWIIFWILMSRLQTERQFWHDIFAGTRLIHTPQ